MQRVPVSVNLITQGEYKFYSGTMNIEDIVESSSVNPRELNPEEGFQRVLNENKARSIVDYIKKGGTIPNAIILSAQDAADFEYNSKNKTISINRDKRSMLILDGQHRVYGFKILSDEKAFQAEKYRIPVIIYTDLTSVQEARIFIDINTRQDPVPKELLLDIKKLAQRESAEEEILDELFTLFENEANSFLYGKLSRFEKAKGKISKVTFYDSIKPLIKEFNINNVGNLYRMINAYFEAVDYVWRNEKYNFSESVTKATVFKIMVAHCRSIASIIADRDPSDIYHVSEYKFYLKRSVSGNIKDILASKSYKSTTDILDRKLLRKSLTI